LAQVWREYDHDGDGKIYFNFWSSVLKHGALWKRSQEIVDRLEDGTILAYGVYYRDAILVEIALLLGAKQGTKCPWTIWSDCPTSKCLFPFEQAYYSSADSAAEVVALVDAKFPCPYAQCK
jgi:hypothetical protein